MGTEMGDGDGDGDGFGYGRRTNDQNGSNRNTIEVKCQFQNGFFSIRRMFDDTAQWLHAQSGTFINMARGFSCSLSFRDGKGEDM